jgi:hypothetical protein
MCQRRTLRRVARVAAASLLAGSVAAVCVLPAAASFTTPVYGMTCDTGEYSSHQGWARCYAPNPSKWKISVDCSYGFTYDSYWVYTGPDQWYTLNSPQTCTFGVNSVRVIEGP